MGRPGSTHQAGTQHKLIHAAQNCGAANEIFNNSWLVEPEDCSTCTSSTNFQQWITACLAP
jgi:hypothetical protein